ncbi:DEAD/DEAH box helicase [Lachnospiraceae bacterium LCP19S3_B12]
MKVTISNEISIQDPSQELLTWVRQNLTLPNPEYNKKLRMGLWTGNTPAQICLYRVDGNKIYIPCGAGKHIRRFLFRDTVVTQDLADNGLLSYPRAAIPLYDYQKDAVKDMQSAGCGILQSPCGSGKTQMGIALAARLQRKTLWVTHTQDLLNQSYDRAAQYFPRDILGTITAGKVQIGSHMTFATVQTLSKLDLIQYKYTWDTIIVDECHRLAGSPTSVTMFYRVMSCLAARYKYGLSATVHRSDGLIQSTFAVVGDVACVVPEAAVAEKTMQVTVLRRDTGVRISRECQDTDGTLDYSRLIPYLTEHPDRCHMIVEDLVKNRNHYNLILSDRLNHLEELMARLPTDLRVQAAMIDGHMTSKTAKAARAQAIEDLRAGRKHFLFASYSLAKEGLDIPRLDRLYLTTPKKDYAVVTQSIGRIARKASGKENAVCYDYVDQIGFCENQWKKRKTSYRKARCRVQEGL